MVYLSLLSTPDHGFIQLQPRAHTGSGGYFLKVDLLALAFNCIKH